MLVSKNNFQLPLAALPVPQFPGQLDAHQPRPFLRCPLFVLTWQDSPLDVFVGGPTEHQTIGAPAEYV